MSEPVKRPRPYSSPRREAQAIATRRAVVRSAHDLFIERGYARTTVADIARHAGVSPETIYATFGNKAALLHRVWDVTVGGDDEDIVFHERPEVVAIRNESDLATRLHMWATFAATTQRRTAPFMVMLQAAAGADDAATDMLAEIGRQRLAGMEVMARSAAETGQLAVPVEHCRDIGWATTDGMLWYRLVHERGWSDDQFAAWLGDVWVTSFVARQPSSPARAKRAGRRTPPAPPVTHR